MDALKRSIESGFSINSHSNLGNTPLHLSVLHNKRELFDYILTVDDVRIDAQNFWEMTPLMCAVQTRQTYYCEQLLAKGASVNVIYKGDNTLLHEVDTNLEIALMLIERDIDVNSVNSSGQTPLYTACTIGAYEIVSMLLCHGADPTIKCCGKLPLAEAVYTFPLIFQEILFDYTFHENEKCPIYIGILLGAASNPLFFDKILEQLSRIEFDDDSLPELASALDKLPFKTFKQIVDLCPKMFLRKFTVWVVCRAQFYFFKNTDVLEYCAFFIRQECFFHWFRLDHLFSTTCSVMNIGDNFRFPEATLNVIIYILLSYGSEFKYCHLESIYDRQGFSAFFETMLHMDVIDILTLPHHYTLVAAIYKIRLNLRSLENPFIDLPQRQRRLSDLSLLELSRNAARTFILDHYGVEKCGQFLAIVKRLNIPTVCKDILILKKLLSKPLIGDDL